MRTIYKQLLSSMLAISVAVPIIILVIFNVVMTNNIQTTAKKELSSTMPALRNIVRLPIISMAKIRRSRR